MEKIEAAHLQLRKEYGTPKLLETTVLTRPMSVSDIVTVKIINDLSTFSYRREQETDADSWSVRYLTLKSKL